MVLPKGKTREEYNEYMRVYMLKRYHRIRNEMLCALGGKCASCGSTETLEIDHIDRTKKTMSVDRMTFVGKVRRTAEMANCQLLCRQCHTAKTVEDDMGRSFAQHGTITMYTHYKCRCSACKAVNTLTSKSYRKSKRKVS